jgi:Pyruvate/2-oxoacid:ferredoxin oxidoreductase delta subunit
VKTTIYYFTGTGNSLKMAKDLAASIAGSELVPMAAYRQDHRITSAAERVGFVHPLYWYGLPGVVREFVKKVDLAPAGYVFSVATCEFPIGFCLQQMASLLAQKGKELAAGFYVPMPNNYILGEYQVTPAGERQRVFRKAAEKVRHIAMAVMAGESHVDGSPVSDADFELVEQLSRKHSAWIKEADTRDSHFVALPTCDGCGVCALVCPVDNIKMENDLPRWLHRCEQCLACTHHCPQCAIQYGQETVGKERYRHPDIPVNEIIRQKRTAV